MLCFCFVDRRRKIGGGRQLGYGGSLRILYRTYQRLEGGHLSQTLTVYRRLRRLWVNALFMLEPLFHYFARRLQKNSALYKTLFT